jgi:hypothetical protein
MLSNLREMHIERCLSSTARSHEEFEAIFEALDQYVSNLEDYIASEDSPDPKAMQMYKVAEEVLNRMAAIRVKLIED